MRNFDGLVTDEEAEKFIYPRFTRGPIIISVEDPDSFTRFDGEPLPPEMMFVSEICRRLERAMTIKGARGVVNKVALFQYVCRAKGCLLGALVPVRGERFWIYQNYVTSVPVVETGEPSPRTGRSLLREVDSMADFISHHTRPQLERDSTLKATTGKSGGIAPYQLSCRHTHVAVTPGFESEIKKAREEKYRALYI